MGNLQEELIRTGLHKPADRAKDSPKAKTGGRAKETLTDRDLRELMGSNQDTYRRVKGGAIRKR